MMIAIIGAGNVGAALATGWSKTGHAITFGVRNPDRPEVVALCRRLGVVAHPSAAAIAEADVIVLALPWTGAEAAVKDLGDLAGRIVLDCMNPLVFEHGALELDRGLTTSGAEALAGWVPQA